MSSSLGYICELRVSTGMQEEQRLPQMHCVVRECRIREVLHNSGMICVFVSQGLGAAGGASKVKVESKKEEEVACD